MSRKVYILITPLAILLLHRISLGGVYSTRDEAISRVFRDGEQVEKITLYLTREEKRRASRRAKAEIRSRLFTYYRGMKDGMVTGYISFASHVVRTKYAVTMVVVNPDMTLRSVEVVAFYEPEEYLPIRRWFEQFAGRRLDKELWPKRGIQTVTGATMSVNSIVREVRKVLAVFETVVSDRR